MGGDTYKRFQKELTLTELNVLASQTERLEDGSYKTPFGLAKSHRLLKDMLARRLTMACRVKFAQLLQQYHKIQGRSCKNCCQSVDFDYELWTTLETGYDTRCLACKTNYSWAKGKFPERGKKISDAKLKFFATEKGQQIAKRVGKKNRCSLSKYFQTEAGQKQLEIARTRQSVLMKQMIQDGRFKPAVTNAWTHWDASYHLDGIRYAFRSSWEACFWYCNQHTAYEAYKISYVDDDGIDRWYIVDFYDETAGVLYELKPTSEMYKQKTKLEAAKAHCEKVGLQFILIDEDSLYRYLDAELFKTAPVDVKLQWERVERYVRKNSDHLEEASSAKGSSL